MEVSNSHPDCGMPGHPLLQHSSSVASLSTHNAAVCLRIALLRGYSPDYGTCTAPGIMIKHIAILNIPLRANLSTDAAATSRRTSQQLQTAYAQNRVFESLQIDILIAPHQQEMCTLGCVCAAVD